MKQSAFILVTVLYSTFALGQNRAMADSLDGVIKRELKKTSRIDYKQDTAYTVCYFEKNTKKLLVAIVTNRQSEFTYNYINEQLVRVRMIVFSPSMFSRPVGKFYFLNNALVYKEDADMEVPNPQELVAESVRILEWVKRKLK